MAFDPMESLRGVASAAAGAGVQQGQELLGQVNLLLTQLQSAGYEIEEMEAHLSVPPEITVQLKTGPTMSDSKLRAAFQANQNNKFIGVILGSLVQANKLRDAVNVDAIDLQGATIVLTVPPKITLKWKAKEEGKAASA